MFLLAQGLDKWMQSSQSEHIFIFLSTVMGSWREHNTDLLEIESSLCMSVESSRASCVLMLFSCFRLWNLSTIISLKSFVFLSFHFISVFFFSVDSQLWSSGCIPDFLEGSVMFSIVFLYVCLSVLFSWLCSAWTSFFLCRQLVMLPDVVFLFDQLFLWFLEFSFGYFSLFQFPCSIFLPYFGLFLQCTNCFVYFGDWLIEALSRYP